MGIVLKHINIQNFMSIRNANINLDNQGLLLIRGENLDDSSFDSNGAGKSSIFEALTYVIFDKSIRGLSGNELINNDAKKNLVVTLEFADGIDEYIIKRYRKHHEFKNDVRLFKNKVNITAKSNKDTNKQIEEIFKMDYTTFTNAILFGSGAIKTFTSASDKEKKEILEGMLNLNVWAKAQERAKERLKDVKEQIQAVLSKTREIERMELETHDSIKELSTMREAQQFTLNEEIEKAQKELETAVIKENDKKDDIIKLEDESFQLAMKETDIEMEVDKLQENIDKLKAYLTEHSGVALQKQDIEARIKENKIHLSMDMNSEKEAKQELVDVAKSKEHCPECEAEFLSSTGQRRLGAIKAKLINIANSKKELVKDIQKLEAQLVEIDKQVRVNENIEAKLESVMEEAQKSKEGILKLQAQRGIVESKIEILKNSDNNIAKLKERVEKLRLSGVNSEFTNLLKCKEQKIEELKEKGEQLVNELEMLKVEQDKLEFAVEAFSNSGIKSYLLDSITPLLNEKANSYLKKLSGGTTEIKFTTQTRLSNGEVRDKFNVEIFNSVGGDNYKANSAGEKRRIDLAISLALQDLALMQSNGSINILLFDEIFDALDNTGCENVIQLLKETQEKVGTIFVISHNESLKTLFEKDLVVTKENGQTTIRG